MYDKEAAIQRPLHPNRTPAESNRITEKNWTSHMGEEKYVYLSDIFLSSASRTGI
jgi:hypothetical protein